MPTVQDIIEILQQIAPENLAEDWDNVGLLVGTATKKVRKALLALDPTSALIAEARAKNADLIITHHPLIFRPVKSLRSDQPTGKLITDAIHNNLSVIGCHTNLDSAIGGVSDVLITRLGCIDSVPLIPKSCGDGDPICGLGRLGRYPSPLPAQHFIDKLRQTCKPPWLLEAGPRPKQVTRIAVCGGSCSDFAETALARGADVFVTAEVKHAAARWAEDAGLWLIDGGHFATENPSISVLAQMLQQKINNASLNIEICTANQQSPLRLI